MTSNSPSRREFVAGLAGVVAGGLLFSRHSAAQAGKPHRIDFHTHSVPPAWRAGGATAPFFFAEAAVSAGCYTLHLASGLCSRRRVILMRLAK